MKVIRCEKNLHWYDADAYAKCPHCNPNIGKIIISDKGKGNDTLTSSSNAFSGEIPTKKDSASFHNNLTDGRLRSTDANKRRTAGRTISAFNNNGNSPAYRFPGPNETESTVSAPEVAEAEVVSNLRKELQSVSNSSVERTVSYFGKVNQYNNNITEAVAAGNPPVSSAPVVGWLVSIAGPHTGQSFTIFAGKNSIGRANDNDIVLSNDPTVSGHKHAWITYESKHRNFILKAGDGRYPDLNGEQVIESKILKTYDRIELGETELLFVNLCGENFAWEDYLNRE